MSKALSALWLAALIAIGANGAEAKRAHYIDLTASFTPGDYTLLCFVPDAKDGKPHIAHGMVKNFTVK